MFVGKRAAELRLFPQCGGRRHILPGIDVVRAQPFGVIEQKHEVIVQVRPHERHEIRFFRRALEPVDKRQKILFVALFDVHEVRKNQFVAADIVISVDGIELEPLAVEIAESALYLRVKRLWRKR